MVKYQPALSMNLLEEQSENLHFISKIMKALDGLPASQSWWAHPQISIFSFLPVSLEIIVWGAEIVWDYCLSVILVV